jgi:2-polyprenyl-3-methyl-5-hydroxy-6-metoxy-1,4-benzoquinol methylase
MGTPGTSPDENGSDIDLDLGFGKFVSSKSRNRRNGRYREPELMDAKDLDPVRHVEALRALARVNRVSLVAARIWREVLHLSRGHRDSGYRERDRPLRLLDVACGGGDVMIDVARRARSASVPLVVHGCDLSSVALEYAQGEAARGGVAAEFFERDVLADGLPGGYDLVCSSLFHHHLSHEDAVGLLRGMAEAGQRVLVQDLLRSALGYWLAWSGLRLLSRSDVAHVDGPRSVRAAFTMPEVRAMAAEAGYVGAVIRRGWPERFILRWRGP